LARLVRRKRKGKRRGAAGSAAAAAGRRGRGGEEKKGGEGETDEWGPGVSESKEKETEREDAGRRMEKDGGLLGCLGRKARR
jgi:hypothetical protein